MIEPDPQKVDRFELQPIVVNTGQTPAYEVKYHSQVCILQFPLPQNFDFPLPLRSDLPAPGCPFARHDAAQASRWRSPCACRKGKKFTVKGSVWLVRRIHSLGERRTQTEDCGQGLGVTLIVPAPLFTGKRLDEPQTEDARRSIQPALVSVSISFGSDGQGAPPVRRSSSWMASR